MLLKTSSPLYPPCLIKASIKGEEWNLSYYPPQSPGFWSRGKHDVGQGQLLLPLSSFPPLPSRSFPSFPLPPPSFLPSFLLSFLLHSTLPLSFQSFFFPLLPALPFILSLSCLYFLSFSLISLPTFSPSFLSVTSFLLHMTQVIMCPGLLGESWVMSAVFMW